MSMLLMKKKKKKKSKGIEQFPGAEKRGKNSAGNDTKHT